MFYPNKKIYHYATVGIIAMVMFSWVIGYSMGHGVMLHDCQDIMSSSLPVPSPIYAFKE